MKRKKTPTAPTLTTEPVLKRNLARRLASRFALRLHVVLIVLWSLAWGAACNKLLHLAGLDSPPWRYSIATVAAWLAMLVAFKLWLAYAGFTQRRKQQSARGWQSDSIADAAADAIDFGSGLPLPRFGGNIGRTAARPGPIGGQGRAFGGGGTSADFEPLADAADSSLLGDAGSGVADSLSSADEALPLVLVIAVVAAAVTACLGVLTYFYTQGPMLLSEAAFEVLLAGGLLRSVRRADEGDWLRTIVVRTAVPWLIVLGCAIGVGLVLR